MNKEEEDIGLSTHMRKRDTQEGTSCAHQHRQTTASYYNRLPSRPADQTTKM